MESTERKPHSLRSVGYFQVLLVHAFSDAVVVSGSIAGEGRRAIEGARNRRIRFASDDNKYSPGSLPS